MGKVTVHFPLLDLSQGLANRDARSNGNSNVPGYYWLVKKQWTDMLQIVPTFYQPGLISLIACGKLTTIYIV